MRRTALWLLASLGLAGFTSVTEATPLKVLSAPNIMRVGTTENVFVECQDCDGQRPMDVQISAWNYPLRNIRLHETTVTLSSDNSFQAFGELLIPPDTFDKDPDRMQYVYLRAEFPESTLEKRVLVSFQAGYIFIQTDKPLYTPDSTVLFRVFGLTPEMKAAAGNVPVVVEFVTPQDIIIPLGSVSLKSGLYHGSYKLGEIVSVGQWKVVARFQSNPQQMFSAKFDVKEYVLPSFEVKLTPESPFYYYGTDSFIVTVTATYLFGTEVDGMAYVVFGVMKDNIRKVFPDSLQRIPINEGSGDATLQKDHILRTFSNIEDLVGGVLFATATVHTESGSEMVEGELRNMHIVKSPYVINFDKTPKYFIKGLPFDVTVTVTNPDGTPAEGIPVVVQPGHIHGTSQANGRVTLPVPTKDTNNLTVTATTNANRLPKDKQTSESMVAKAQESKGGDYIHITSISAEVKFGSDLRVSLNMNQQPQAYEITYLIISRGQLVDFGRQRSDSHTLIVMNIPVTEKMLPSFRLVVFYHPTPSEVVSDSVWLDVDDSCMGSLTLAPKRQRSSYEPQETFVLRISGDPGATVGLVAVDKGVYVLNKKHLLTQKKVWETVEKADTGCTPGRGINSMGVFFDAGLMFQTDAAGGTPYRQEVQCPRPSARKRRAPTVLDVRTTLASKYSDPLQRDCCRDGMKSTPLSYTCAQRTLYITDGKACADAFLDCCEELAKQRSELKKNNLILARSEEDNGMEDSEEITSRTKFPESWQWVTYDIPPCAGSRDCKVNTKDIHIPLKESITTWVFTGISLSQSNGICVGKPLDVVVFKNFFLDLRLPYSAVVEEQIEFRAIVHNYIDDKITVLIDLIDNTDICSLATKRGKHRQTVTIDPATTKAVPFVVIPMKEGLLNIEVKAYLKGRGSQGDGVIKPLRVVSKGVLTKVKKIVQLAPKGGTQELTINNPIPRTDMFPNSKTSTKVFITGREQVSPLLETVTGVSPMGNIIYQPTGCAEQNLVHMINPVLATIYLDRTNQWDVVGREKRSEALSHIKTGVQNEMEYAKSDGSFCIWKGWKSSTWLTAYVVRVFSMASSLVDISSNTICDAAKFLIQWTQLPNGRFREIWHSPHRMFTAKPGRDSDASVTAFVLLALQESQTLCYRSVKGFPVAMEKAVSYLEQRFNNRNLTDPYAVAITSYALASANQLNPEILYDFVSPDGAHWEVPDGEQFTLEATAYALLTLVKIQLLKEARPVVRWLTEQRKVGGGYGSTQATVLVYQALFEYWSVAQEPNYALDVQLTVPGRTAPYSYRFTQDNQYTTRTSKNYEGNQDVKVTATGTGEATLTLETQFYAIPKETLSDCRKFNLSVEFSLDKVEEEGNIYKLRMYFTFINETEDASMSILDISMPTGFIQMNEDLNQLSGGRAPVLSEWEYNKRLSEKGSIILYLPKVAHNRTEEVTFRMRQAHKVGVLQPASVSIYEYYDETKCVRYYHPQRKDGQLLYRCRGDECLCAEENCSMQQKGRISNQRRLSKACETNQTSFIDFAYNVTLEAVHHDVTFDTYTMLIETVIKDGSYDKNPQGQRRSFLSLSQCRGSLGLQKGKGYLIMGTADSTRLDPSSKSFEYELGERSWIEYWPRGEDCHRPEHRRTCIDLETLVFIYETRGCTNK